VANGDGLVAAYAFDEGAGATVTDLSGNGNHGIATNADWATGKYGKAISFGAGSLVSVPDNSLLDITGNLTLEAWVYPTNAASAWQNVILKGGPNTVLSYILNGAGMPGFAPSFYVNVAASGVFSTGTLPLNAWTHLAGTYDGSTMKIYINGALAGSAPQTGALAASSDGLYIGGNPYWGHNFTGLIDEVRIYNRSLAPSEIQADMITPIASARPQTPPNLRVVSQ
jgi:hypothetical protein